MERLGEGVGEGGTQNFLRSGWETRLEGGNRDVDFVREGLR